MRPAMAPFSKALVFADGFISGPGRGWIRSVENRVLCKASIDALALGCAPGPLMLSRDSRLMLRAVDLELPIAERRVQ